MRGGAERLNSRPHRMASHVHHSLFDCFGSISRALRFLRYLIVSRTHLDLSFI